MRRILLAAALISLSAPALAADETAKPETNSKLEEAKVFLRGYLDALAKASQGQGRKPKPQEVSKKLLSTRKYLHPRTIERIAEQEKKGIVTNALAVWYWAKADYWLKEYEIGEAKLSVLDTVIIEAQEKNWRVEEGGEDGEPEPTSYLLMKTDDKWQLIDKRRNSSFTKDAIKIGYRDYFARSKDEQPADNAKPAGNGEE